MYLLFASNGVWQCLYQLHKWIKLLNRVTNLIGVSDKWFVYRALCVRSVAEHAVNTLECVCNVDTSLQVNYELSNPSLHSFRFICCECDPNMANMCHFDTQIAISLVEAIEKNNLRKAGTCSWSVGNVGFISLVGRTSFDCRGHRTDADASNQNINHHWMHRYALHMRKPCNKRWWFNTGIPPDT